MKTILYMITVVVLTIALSACGGNSETGVKIRTSIEFHKDRIGTQFEDDIFIVGTNIYVVVNMEFENKSEESEVVNLTAVVPKAEFIDATQYNAFIFTSANAIRNLKVHKQDKSKLCFCVGAITEKIARMSGYNNLISNLLKQENFDQIKRWIEEAFKEWKKESNRNLTDNKTFVFNNKSARSTPPQEQLYVDIEEYEGNIHSKKWQVPMSLRVIEPEAAIKINSI
mgnify:CR=1 FL=1